MSTGKFDRLEKMVGDDQRDWTARVCDAGDARDESRKAPPRCRTQYRLISDLATDRNLGICDRLDVGDRRSAELGWRRQHERHEPMMLLRTSRPFAAN